MTSTDRTEEPKALTLPERMIAASKGMLVEKLDGSVDWQQALAVAEQTKPGLVIATPEEAVHNADQTMLLVKGQRAGEAAKKWVLEIPRLIQRAVNDLWAPRDAKIATAIAQRNQAKVAWDREVERRAAEQARLEREAAEAEQAQAAEAAAEDEVFIPLDVPLAPPPPSKTITTNAGQQVSRKTLKAELVDIHAVDPAWVELKWKPATDAFREALARRDVEEPGIGSEHGKVLRGVRFFYEPGVQNRVSR